jgi:hypothetical protein
MRPKNPPCPANLAWPLGRSNDLPVVPRVLIVMTMDVGTLRCSGERTPQRLPFPHSRPVPRYDLDRKYLGHGKLSVPHPCPSKLASLESRAD